MKLSLVLVFLSFFNLIFAQSDTLNVKIGKYKFRAVHVDTNYSTTLKVTDGNDVIYNGEYEERIDFIKEVDFNKDGNKTILINTYTGGAHCCNILLACKIKNDKLITTDTLYLADSYPELEDLDKNDRTEITAYNMMFAYAFTNFAETRAPRVIYTVENGKFKEITKNYPALLKSQIDEWMTDLRVYLDSNYQCPAEGEEAFNTDAGSVQTILAAITANYFILGDVEKGYDLILKTYKCPDIDKFTETLQKDYKLK
jgi:hypothetical protein